jgi:hypothetical protein
MIKLDSNSNKLRKAYHFLLIRLLLKKERREGKEGRKKGRPG